MEELQKKLLSTGGIEAAQEYFEAQQNFKDAKNAKTKAINNQLKLWK